MNIQLDSGQAIGGSDLLSAIFRSDLVPVPITLELLVKANDALYSALSVGKQIIIKGEIALNIVKSQVLNEQSVKAGRRIAAIHAVAVLAGCEPLLSVAKQAVSLKNTSFNEVYRALGAKIRIKRDIKLEKFICLKGQAPTHAIALALQKEAAVICYQSDGLSVLRLNELMSGDAILFDKSAVQWVSNPNITIKGNINYLSIGDNGSDIIGQVREQRPIDYYPRVNNRELQNLRRILITKATITRPLDDRLDAGKLVMVDDKKLVVLTGAHRFDSGALGGGAVTATKAWLASLEGGA